MQFMYIIVEDKTLCNKGSNYSNKYNIQYRTVMEYELQLDIQ